MDIPHTRGDGRIQGMSKGQPESKVQAEILQYLHDQGIFAFRVNNAPVWDRHLNNGYGAYRSQGKWAALGLSDIIAVINGRAHFIEVKTPTGRQSADQKLFERRAVKAGAIYILARGVEDVRDILKT